MNKLLIVAAGAGLAALLLTLRNPQGAGYALGAGAVDLVDGVISGVVLNTGDALGLPRTDLEKGRAAMAAGNLWDASFLLPAPEFIAGAWDYVFN